MSNPFHSRRQAKSLLWAVLLLVIAAGVGAGTWWWRHLPPTEEPRPPVDMTALLRLNNEGVGQMERFKHGYLLNESSSPRIGYDLAVECFEKVVAMDSNWLPGK